MLPKEYRLKKRKAFSATYKTGTSFHIDGITLFCGKKKDNNYPTKVGFVVSKKIHKDVYKRQHKSFIREHNTIKVDQKLIDKMINAPEIIKPIEPVAEEVKQEEISVEEEHPQIIQEPITDGSVNIDTIELDMQPEPYKTQEVASLDFEQAETEEAEETVTTNLSSDVQDVYKRQLLFCARLYILCRLYKGSCA